MVAVARWLGAGRCDRSLWRHHGSDADANSDAYAESANGEYGLAYIWPNSWGNVDHDYRYRLRLRRHCFDRRNFGLERRRS